MRLLTLPGTGFEQVYGVLPTMDRGAKHREIVRDTRVWSDVVSLGHLVDCYVMFDAVFADIAFTPPHKELLPVPPFERLRGSPPFVTLDPVQSKQKQGALQASMDVSRTVLDELRELGTEPSEGLDAFELRLLRASSYYYRTGLLDPVIQGIVLDPFAYAMGTLIQTFRDRNPGVGLDPMRLADAYAWWLKHLPESDVLDLFPLLLTMSNVRRPFSPEVGDLPEIRPPSLTRDPYDSTATTRELAKHISALVYHDLVASEQTRIFCPSPVRGWIYRLGVERETRSLRSLLDRRLNDLRRRDLQPLGGDTAWRSVDFRLPAFLALAISRATDVESLVHQIDDQRANRSVRKLRSLLGDLEQGLSESELPASWRRDIRRYSREMLDDGNSSIDVSLSFGLLGISRSAATGAAFSRARLTSRLARGLARTATLDRGLQRIFGDDVSTSWKRVRAGRASHDPLP